MADDVWNDVLSFDDVNDSTECFVTVLQGLLDVLLSLRRVRIKQHINPWAANGRVINVRRLRDKLYHQALSYGFPEDWQLFCRARNKLIIC